MNIFEVKKLRLWRDYVAQSGRVCDVCVAKIASYAYVHCNFEVCEDCLEQSTLVVVDKIMDSACSDAHEYLFKRYIRSTREKFGKNIFIEIPVKGRYVK